MTNEARRELSRLPLSEMPYGWTWPFPGSARLRRVDHLIHLVVAKRDGHFPDWGETQVAGESVWPFLRDNAEQVSS